MAFQGRALFYIHKFVCTNIGKWKLYTQLNIRQFHASNLCKNKNNETLETLSILPITLETKTKENVSLNISFSDMRPNMPADGSPLVVALHGAPGGAADFQSLSSDLKSQGVRFLTLEFPGYGNSILRGMDIYRLDHSTEGRFMMLKEMLRALDIDRVDVLVSHSAGTWLGYKASAELDIVKSAIFINPLGRTHHRTCRPWWLLKMVAGSLRSPLLHPVMYRLLPKVYRNLGFDMDESAYPTLPIAVETVRAANFELMSSYAEKIVPRKIPLTVAVCKSDSIVEWTIGVDMAGLLGINEGETILYDRDGQPSKDPFQNSEGSWYKKLLVFARGGHVIQTAHMKEISRHVLQLIDISKQS